MSQLPTACNEVAEPTNRIALRVQVGERPAARGGTLVDGTYESVESIDWESTAVPSTSPDMSDRLVVKGDLLSTAGRQPADGPTDRRTFRLTITGTTLLYSAVCPADGSEIEFGFTATATELRLYKPPTGPRGYEYVLKRLGP